MPEARRTLVKSPPELWAEISDPDCLARHLEPFGEVRITRVDPETTVAWEGDRARGTVELAASGWGTKVTLTAEPLDVEEEPALQQPLAADEPEVDEPEAEVAPEPEAEVAPEPEAEAAPEPEPEEPEVAAAPEPEAAAAPEPEAAPTPEPEAAAPEPTKKRGFFARLFGRRKPEVVAEPEPHPVVVAEPEPEVVAVAAPEPEVVAEPEVEPEPEPVAEEPAAVEEPEVVAEEIRVSRMADDEAAAVLDGVLDTLGAAHHRPFSR